MRIYHNPRCSKSRETLKLIQDAGIDPEIVDYLNDVPSAKELTGLIKLLRIAPEELVRKGEEEYKSLFKGKDMTDEQWIEAMVNHPKLIERPIVVSNKKAVIGRPTEKVRELF